MIRKRARTLVRSAPFNLGVCAAILIALLVVMPMQTLPGLSQQARDHLFVAELAIMVLFTIEFALRLVAGGRRYLFGWGIIEFTVIATYFLHSVGLLTVDYTEVLRVIRLLLLLRLIRSLKKPFGTLWRAFLDVRFEIGVFMLIVLVLVYSSALLFYSIENETNVAINSMYDALWWAIVTLTTLGYGDITPVTVMGKVMASIMIIFGVLVVAIPAGLLASELIDQRRDQRDKAG